MFHKKTLKAQMLFVLIILSVILMVGCAAKKNLWGDLETGLILQYRMPENQVLKYQTSNEFIQSMKVMGQSVEVEINKTYTFSVKSKGLKEDNHQLEVTIDSMKANLVTQQGGLFPDMSNVIGKSFDMTLSPLGKELDLSGAESIQYEIETGSKSSIVSDFQTVFPDLAGMPVKIGDTWTTKDTITIKESNNEINIIANSVNTLEGFETVNGLECAKITAVVTGALNGEGEQQGMYMNLEGEMEGTDIWYFAYKKGLFVKMLSDGSTEGTVTVSGPQNMIIPMTVKIKIETILVK